MVGDGWWHGTIVDMSQVKVHIDTETCVIYDSFIFYNLSLSLCLGIYICIYILYIYIIYPLSDYAFSSNHKDVVLFPWLSSDLRPFQELKMGDFAKEPPAKRQKSTQDAEPEHTLWQLRNRRYVKIPLMDKILQTSWDREITICSINIYIYINYHMFISWARQLIQ